MKHDLLILVLIMVKIMELRSMLAMVLAQTAIWLAGAGIANVIHEGDYVHMATTHREAHLLHAHCNWLPLPLKEPVQ